jgi:hypothetical protein
MYRYFRLDGAESGVWPANAGYDVGAVIRINLSAGGRLPGMAWNDETKDWVQPRWIETSDPSVPKAPDDGLREAVLAYIGVHEHDDEADT